MKAIILAAGYATRLYPLTLTTPKPLLTVGGIPMIEHIINKIEEINEVDHIYIVTNNKFYEHFQDWKENVSSSKSIIIINDNTIANEDRLGAIGDILFTIKKMSLDDDLLVIAGDNLFSFSLLKLLALSHEKNASAITLYDLKDPVKLAGRLGCVAIDDNHKIISFEEKPLQPKSALAATVCYLIRKQELPELEKCMKENQAPDNCGDFIRYLTTKKDVYAYVADGVWFDIGNPQQYKEANALYAQHKITARH